MTTRRDFLRLAGLTSFSVALPSLPLWALEGRGVQKLTILHTNDVHSHVEPFQRGRNAGLGGAARRAALIQQIRQEEEHVLLLDAGDMFQGTPYFNFYGGELEFKLMSAMNYDAATIGNHDFDGGIDGLEKQLVHANFPLVISNYDFSDTIMNGKTQPFKIIRKGKLKIGIFGLGIELDGLVPEALYKKTRYLDPLPIAKQTAEYLKQEEKCDFVICLSHLGYKYKYEKVSDHVIAEHSKDIDLIIGGHTHTFLDQPTEIANAEGQRMLINQVGFAGINLGRIDVYFDQKKDGSRFVEGQPILVK
ncbi:MAG: metallophosphatase [Saprospiraceae bacterium]|nr:metallophosphatase [Saprospiraceae bacterium]